MFGNNYYPYFKHSGTMVFDNRIVKDRILADHRVTDAELKQLITYCYIEGLREYYRTPFLFRFNGNHIDDDLYKGIVMYDYEKEWVDELMEDLVHLIAEQYSAFIEQQLYYKPPYLTVLHITNIIVTKATVCLEYTWEK